MGNSTRIDAIRSYIVACCADGKIKQEEYLYLKKQSQRFKIKEEELKGAIHSMLLSMGKDKCIQRDYKNCVIFTKEALKFQPDNQDTIRILSNAIGSLEEKDLLELARTTINGLEVYKNLLFDKIKSKGSDYHSRSREADMPDPGSKDKAIEFLSVAEDIKPDDEEVKTKLNELMGRSGFSLIDEREVHPDLPDTFRDVKLYKVGGMASIYTATYFDPDSRWHERKVIIKILNNKTNQQTIQKLFFKEYNILRDIDHSNILKIIRRGKTGDLEYYISEFIQGKNLHELIEEGRGLSKKYGKRNRLYDILNGILTGLQGIHEEGIIHRDIKPANIIITNSANKVKIIDFGLAKTDVYQDKLKEAGTRPYSAPELLTHAFAADNRADIYSFGIVMLELISGRNNREFVHILPAAIPGLRAIITKCTEEAVEARYNYISEVLDDVMQTTIQEELAWCSNNFIDQEIATARIHEAKKATYEHQSSDQRRSVKPWLVALIVLVLAVGGYFGYLFLKSPNATTIELAADSGDEKILQLGTENAWTFKTTLDWLAAEQRPESGDLLLTAKSGNTSFSDRSGELVVEYADGSEKIFRIVQSGLFPRLKVDPEELVFAATAEQRISIHSNLSWNVEVSDTWLVVEPMNGSGDGTLQVRTANDNPDSEIRTARITISGVEKKKEVILTVNQYGNFKLDVSPDLISIDPSADFETTVVVDANFAWVVNGVPDWCLVVPTEGKAGEQSITIKHSGASNPPQNGELIISAKNDAVDVGRIQLLVGKREGWSEDDLIRFVESIRGSSEPIDEDKMYRYVDRNCAVYYMKDGKKLRIMDSFEDFIYNVKLGSSSSVVHASVKYNNSGKIIEFGQKQ